MAKLAKFVAYVLHACGISRSIHSNKLHSFITFQWKIFLAGTIGRPATLLLHETWVHISSHTDPVLLVLLIPRGGGHREYLSGQIHLRM